MSATKILEFAKSFDLLDSSEKIFALVEISQKLEPSEQLFVSSVINTNAQAHIGKQKKHGSECLEATQQLISTSLGNSGLPEKDLLVFTGWLKQFKGSLQNPSVEISCDKSNNTFKIPKNPFRVAPIIRLLGKTGDTNDLKILRQLSKAHFHILSPIYFDRCGLTVTITKPERTRANLILNPTSKWSPEMAHVYRNAHISLTIPEGYKVCKVLGEGYKSPEPRYNFKHEVFPILKQYTTSLTVFPTHYDSMGTLLELACKFTKLKTIELVYKDWNFVLDLGNLNYILRDLNLKPDIRILLRLEFSNRIGSLPNDMEQLNEFFIHLSNFKNLKILLEIKIYNSDAFFDLITQLVVDNAQIIEGVSMHINLATQLVPADLSKPQVESNLLKLSPFLTRLSYHERYTSNGVLWDFSHLNCPRIKKS